MTETMVLVEVAVGELIDKITILQIKSERIDDEAKLANIRHELRLLDKRKDELPCRSTELETLQTELKKVNVAIWDIEDSVRAHEREKDFGDAFVAVARSVYQTNDRRADLKRQINLITGSLLVEEKSYARY